jgi:D-psicose/D-tagatose/L-ribulose 3-epimerase
LPQFGAHVFIWSGEWTSEEAERVIIGAADAGLDFVEIPLLHPEGVFGTRVLLDRYGIDCVCSLGLPKEAHLPSAPKEAEAFLKRAVNVAVALNSPILTGVIYAHIGTLTSKPPTEEELAATARVLKKVARYATERGISLGIEAINRYETYLINLADQARVMVDRVGEPNVFVHLDTYHMNIEETMSTRHMNWTGKPVFSLR